MVVKVLWLEKGLGRTFFGKEKKKKKKTPLFFARQQKSLICDLKLCDTLTIANQ